MTSNEKPPMIGRFEKMTRLTMGIIILPAFFLRKTRCLIRRMKINGRRNYAKILITSNASNTSDHFAKKLIESLINVRVSIFHLKNFLSVFHWTHQTHQTDFKNFINRMLSDAKFSVIGVNISFFRVNIFPLHLLFKGSPIRKLTFRSLSHLQRSVSPVILAEFKTRPSLSKLTESLISNQNVASRLSSVFLRGYRHLSFSLNRRVSSKSPQSHRANKCGHLSSRLDSMGMPQYKSGPPGSTPPGRGENPSATPISLRSAFTRFAFFILPSPVRFNGAA